jgi:cation transport regulator
VPKVATTEVMMLASLFPGWKMPYKKLDDLPESIRTILPEYAQEIYLQAYRNAWEQYEKQGLRRGEATREATADKVAWAAVRQEYRKDLKGSNRQKSQLRTLTPKTSSQ